MAVEMDGDICEHKPHIIRMVKNRFPALAHRFPALQQVPPGMHALGPVCLHPDRSHLLDVQALKGTVKLLICTPDLRQNFVLGWHGYSLISGCKNVADKAHHAAQLYHKKAIGARCPCMRRLA
jgi:hypothetical protein